jgi:hypothetical protein
MKIAGRLFYCGGVNCANDLDDVHGTYLCTTTCICPVYLTDIYLIVLPLSAVPGLTDRRFPSRSFFSCPHRVYHVACLPVLLIPPGRPFIEPRPSPVLRVYKRGLICIASGTNLTYHYVVIVPISPLHLFSSIPCSKKSDASTKRGQVGPGGVALTFHSPDIRPVRASPVIHEPLRLPELPPASNFRTSLILPE